MHGLEAALAEARLLGAMMDECPPACRVALCPPATLIRRMTDLLAGSSILVGGQDCHPRPSGAFTGDISAEMLADAGAALVIVGHSERRLGHGEDDGLVSLKAAAALRGGLEPIVCVGESHGQHLAGDALRIVTGQIRGSLPGELRGRDFAVAYEPVWAIGTGLTPSSAEIEEVHGAIRDTLLSMFGADGGAAPILYGGSVKPANAREILKLREVGGALVGGASLKATEFAAICGAV